MTSTAVATLPSGSDPSQWSEEEKALVSAAGLVHTDNNGNQEAAPRPVVASFLQHCARTGLDPFARQIYAIARKNRGNLQWTTQISIDGARLVAERTGEYEGQTTPEFTADGVTWTEVWLDEENQPKAARVGVYRRGFREPLYAIALWKAYAVYHDDWSNGAKTGGQKLSAMWSKMGPLMLAKCAEMLALRKAFPQDLSGLYSTEEMDQAGAPREVVRQVEKTAGAAPVEAEQAEIAPAQLTRDWKAEATQLSTLDELTELANQADRLGEIGIVVSEEDGKVIDVLKRRRAAIQAATTPELVTVPPKVTGARQWLREARDLTTRAEVKALVVAATAAGTVVQVIEELEAIARSLPDEVTVEPVTSWPVAEIPQSTEWAPEPDAPEEVAF